MEGTIVRKARPEDREEVLSFCIDTFDWGDYIDEVFDIWLKAPDSLLLVAETQGKPVGIIHARLMDHGAAWLEGLRVRPSHRRLGAGRAMTRKALELLGELGHHNVRLLTESNNEASMSLVAAEGFTEETRWAFYHGKEPTQLPSVGSRWVTPATAMKLWAEVDSSDLFNRGGRIQEYDWALYPLEADDFAALVKRRMVAVSGKGAASSMAIVHNGPEERRMAKACFLLGDAPQVADLALFVICESAKAGAHKLNVSCPNHAGTVEGLKAAGFRPAFRSSIVYLRKI
ncbi:MAG: GNAT family N-acetyltransferase [Conexivisphaerales archaeon]